MLNRVSGTLTTNPSLKWIAYEDADSKYFPPDYNSAKVPRVRFSLRFDDYPIPVEVEIDGDLAIEINENLRRGDRCTLNGIVQGEDPIRPYRINYERKSTLIPLSSNLALGRLHRLSDEDHYEHILNIIESISQTMVRDPSSFSTMDEESLRSWLLACLNGHYKGQATGETFNYGGKVDILIRINDENIFIGECKFWHGPKKLTGAIDQLLGYISLHDDKVALIIFNRNKDFSKVLDSIKSTTKEHPNCKRELDPCSETSFRFIFSHRDDPNREMTLTVMAFNVPR